MDLPDIDPGASVGGALRALQLIDSTYPGYVNIKVLVMKDDCTFWTDTMRVFLAPVKVKPQEAPLTFTLEQNYPNPFNPTTTIRYTIPGEANVKITVYNVLGQKAAELVNREVKAGTYEIKYDASGLTSGVYIYKIEAGGSTAVRKMMLIK